MKRIVAVFASVFAAVLVGSIPVQANTIITQHGPTTIDIGPPGCLNGDMIMSGNAVFHLTVNNAGDSWLTETIEGTATVNDAVTGALLFTGHGAAWFGLETNKSNGVLHFTNTAVGTVVATGAQLTIHTNGDFTQNANGVITVSNIHTTCG